MTVALIASLAGIESALALDCATQNCWINGTISCSDTGGVLVGAVVVNASNSSQTDTTGADGYYNISWFKNSSATQHDLSVEAEGFTAGTIDNIYILDASNNTETFTGETLTIITPVNSAVTSASVTKNSATISWTVNATDSVNNNYVGNKIVWYASGVPSETSTWSNTTVSPSFSLSNLRENLVYTYTVYSYNSANNSYSDSDSSTFTTLKAGVKSKKTPVPTAIKPKATPAKKSIATMITPSNHNQIAFLVILVIIGVAAYFIVTSKGKKKK